MSTIVVGGRTRVRGRAELRRSHHLLSEREWGGGGGEKWHSECAVCLMFVWHNLWFELY
jgi:hypothetical protein